jgi:hypothetical protein
MDSVSPYSCPQKRKPFIKADRFIFTAYFLKLDFFAGAAEKETWNKW